MTPQEFERKLTAILSADVAGYSRLMGDNEELTIRTLTGHREMMTTLITQNKGRVVDAPGDNLLAGFSSVTRAVDCAVEIQRELAERNEELPDDRKMEYRIGVNLGDVIEEGDRIYGDGVNIAARLESLAEPGSICISGFVYNQVKNRLKLEYEFIGEQTVKNIKEPVPAYRVLSFPGAAAHRVIKAKKTAETSWRKKISISIAALLVIVVILSIWNFYLRTPTIEPASIERMAYPLPKKPSIAVLPFMNMSGDPEQEYLGDGISENITSTLSKIGNMLVIASNSTFTYKGKPVKIQQVAEELGVHYVLEGSVQKAGERLRVTAQLIDALTGHHLWSEKYDRKMVDLFDLQDEITKKITVSLEVVLTRGREIIIDARGTDNLEAWGKVTKGHNLWIKLTKEDNQLARRLFEEAVRLDPNYASAWAWIGLSYCLDAEMRWSDSPFESWKLAQEAGQKALSIDDQHPQVFNMQGTFHLGQRQYDKAIAKIKKAIALDPNFYRAYYMLARTMFYLGRFEESIEMTKKAMRLCPNYPILFLNTLGRTYAWSGRYDEAISAFNILDERCRKGECPGWRAPLGLAWIYTELGKEDEARAYMLEALKINPNLSLEAHERSEVFKNRAHLQRELLNLRNAGMPEKPLRAVP